ncbi:hypothetical protein MMG00_01060 [Ignatzschineria rhizosphaerae]|uniref:Aminoglycoside/hydroxyurea antibiotic resistance kinase n=1 Tax=Ignatzschineria rhizosphaerae TaxID=2923279 RepID=A0ABY3X0V1_9GAMM|nr:aminoglycoside phosphotransferase family protein [Ignatzschineria rhizosphaerae]UNM96488.1 hypothetical protein MMG00_01060 [Ignatzschineria rhizosphaerae]
MKHDQEKLRRYLSLWELSAVEDPFYTATSLLQKVVDTKGRFCLLKITNNADEMRGIAQLEIWSKADNGASVKVFQTGHEAILLAYAKESRSLLPEALDEKGHISVSARMAKRLVMLHQSPPLSKFKDLIPLTIVFESSMLLETDSVLLQKAKLISQELLNAPVSHVSLHGDAHHGNFLYFSATDVRAIDSKGFYGEHYFDYLPLFINPDLGMMRVNIKLFEEKLVMLCHSDNDYGLERDRLIRWIYVGCALSAAWFLEDNMQEEAQQQLRLLAFIDSFL